MHFNSCNVIVNVAYTKNNTSKQYSIKLRYNKIARQTNRQKKRGKNVVVSFSKQTTHDVVGDDRKAKYFAFFCFRANIVTFSNNKKTIEYVICMRCISIEMGMPGVPTFHTIFGRIVSFYFNKNVNKYQIVYKLDMPMQRIRLHQVNR